MDQALIAADGLGMDCVQVFTANQRQWKPKPPDADAIAAWHDQLAATPMPVVSHDSYLINLASGNASTREKSVALFRAELERCEALAIPHVVMHPGAHLGAGRDEGIRRIARCFDRLHRDLPGYRVVTLLEVTAGQGTTLGERFEHLAAIRDAVTEPDRLAVCLDTCHLLAAGYDLTSAAGARATLDELDDVLGLDLVRCVHMNDSKHPRGSRKDRHDHIGQGHVALDAFAVFVHEPAFATVPKVLETPKGDADDGRPWDTVNLDTLRKLPRP